MSWTTTNAFGIPPIPYAHLFQVLLALALVSCHDGMGTESGRSYLMELAQAIQPPHFLARLILLETDDTFGRLAVITHAVLLRGHIRQHSITRCPPPWWVNERTRSCR